MPKEPLKLMPLGDLKKVVAALAKLPKDAIKGVMPRARRKNQKPSHDR
jgi:hypothetical protein